MTKIKTTKKREYGLYKVTMLQNLSKIQELFDKGYNVKLAWKKLNLDITYQSFCQWLKKLDVTCPSQHTIIKKEADHSSSHGLSNQDTTSTGKNLPIWARITGSPDTADQVSCPENKKDPDPRIKTVFDQ